MTKESKITLLISILFLGFIMNLAYISVNKLQTFDENSKYYQNEELFSPKISQSLPYWAIKQNTSRIYRLYESINFTIDTFPFVSDGANYTKIKIAFSNGTTKHYDMQFDGNNKFSYEYKPGYNAPLGFQNVSFLIYNYTNQLLNSQSTYTNFTILTNYLVSLNSSEYYIEDFLSADMIVSNFSNYDFTWNVSIVDNLEVQNQKNLINLGKKIVQFTFPIKNETFVEKNQYYFIQLNMTDKNSGMRKTAYFPFYVRNNDPFISKIELSSSEIYRTDDCTISFNATDIETLSENLVPTMKIYDAQGNYLLQHTIDFESENLFSDTFVIPAYRPVGKYRIEVTVTDEHEAFYVIDTYLDVKNNAPEIHSYTINDMSMNQIISIPYGRNLVFKFNVSDIEGVSYVQVALLNEDNEWYNITKKYTGQNTEITIRTVDLLGGIWYAYIYVIDSDGEVTSLIDDYDKAPQGIRIIPDVLSSFLPLILFFTGLIIGILVGVGIIYGYFKAKSIDSQKITPKKKKEEIIKKRGTKKKESTKPITTELEKEELEEKKDVIDEEKEEISKRKIKRKL